MSFPTLGERVPKRGNRLTRALARALYRLLGWRFEGELPNREKLLLIAAPHTTAWDFAIAMVAIFAVGVRVSWLGADWIFRFPLTRRLGGIPVDRSRSHGAVDTAIEAFETREKHYLGLAPEGSRKRVPWKSGFYHIAHGAGVPILLASIDHREKLVRLGPTLEPTGDFEADMAKIRAYYAEYVDKYPDNFEV